MIGLMAEEALRLLQGHMAAVAMVVRGVAPAGDVSPLGPDVVLGLLMAK